jgi:hypothetical protein
MMCRSIKEAIMTYQEIVAQARQLPIQQRLALIDIITRSLQLDLRDNQSTAPDPTTGGQLRPNAAGSTLHRIRGIAATNPPLSDADVDAILLDARLEKYVR